MMKDLITKNRSYRRFHEDKTVDRDTLRELIDLARLSASAANLQPLKYVLSCEPEKNAIIFQHLAWAAYLEDWVGPAAGERPAAYIIILGDTAVAKHFHCDHGIAAQSILLGATEKGLGGCMLGSIKRDELKASLQIPEQYNILMVIALGSPKEKCVVDTVDSTGNIKYWRDDDDAHHVPKRSLDEIVVG